MKKENFEARLYKEYYKDEEQRESDKPELDYKKAEKWKVEANSIEEARWIAMEDIKALPGVRQNGREKVRFWGDLPKVRIESCQFRIMVTHSWKSYRVVIIKLGIKASDFISRLNNGLLRLEEFAGETMTASACRHRIKYYICGKEVPYCTDCYTPESRDIKGVLHVHHKYGREDPHYNRLPHDENFIVDSYDVLCPWCHAIHHNNPDIINFTLNTLELKRDSEICKQVIEHIRQNALKYRSLGKFKALPLFYDFFEELKKTGEPKKTKTESSDPWIEHEPFEGWEKAFELAHKNVR